MLEAPAPRPTPAYPVTLRELDVDELERLYLYLDARRDNAALGGDLPGLERMLGAVLATVYGEIVRRSPAMTTTVRLTNLLDPDGPPVMARVDAAGRWLDGAK